MFLKANAKINLSLDILGRREDGYHEVRMVMQMTGLYDGVTLSPMCGGSGVELTSSLSWLPTDGRNLAVRAAKLLMKEKDVDDGLKIKLDKFIPVSAGLAGGSSDAAQVMIGVNSIFGLGFTNEELMERAARLGADVPYCVLGGTALAEGIGEILTPLPKMPDCFLLLCKPNISISTREAYETYDNEPAENHPDIKAQIEGLRRGDLRVVSSPGSMENVFETAARRRCPEIGEIEREMLDAGALAARMSGSGPTVFGIFEKKDAAEKCRTEILKSHPAAWTFVTWPEKNGGRQDD